MDDKQNDEYRYCDHRYQHPLVSAHKLLYLLCHLVLPPLCHCKQRLYALSRYDIDIGPLRRGCDDKGASTAGVNDIILFALIDRAGILVKLYQIRHIIG